MTTERQKKVEVTTAMPTQEELRREQSRGAEHVREQLHAFRMAAADLVRPHPRYERHCSSRERLASHPCFLVH